MSVKLLCSSLLVAALMLSTRQRAKAEIIVDFSGPVSIAAGGGVNFIDVYISSTTGTDNLDLFGAEFLISPVGGAAVGGLQFGTQLEGQLAQPNYVHGVNSVGSPIGNVSGVNNETYSGGDATLNGLGTLLPLDPLNRLLFRLDLTTTTAAEGDQYQLTLVNSMNTFFQDENFNPLDINGSSFTNLGTINVTAAAVPEPSSLILLGLGTAAWGWRHRRKLRDAAT